ncbi:NAD-dependent epimerase/dehydratase family protein [Mesorhizobium sp. BR1-1-16]|uniref:NAD-dependent epimerase/dehydratase family protein n=1 Tax=Mesorhizobium sp. BR1-1-16 TaxID=2876653 RepID=UPI001CCC82F3|nr:NAD-dependent epimerase/dehydratase family protein [Mesorhizobium sp. BR1-1-16]MBZ9938552.1 NAD-dependent epimerase/dehydratase family protein [Mesorhizobium sp. BR1-1-16]
MALSVLYIGGTGQISLPCVEASAAAGHDVTVLNRGKTSVPLPTGVKTLVGDMNDATYGELAGRHFDVVAQFRLYNADQMRRDIDTFSGKTGQYVFISSASVYEKPVRNYMMTERTPLENKYWKYSRDKIACELLLRDQGGLPYTIVRPSHTVRTGMPIQVGDPDIAIRRMIAGKPVVLTGDGSSLWTLTRSVDVATPFVRLLGNARALGDDFHITTDRGFTWNQIHDAIARGFGVKAIHAHVPTDTLVRFDKEWEGPLLGDKSWSALFDNSKVKSVAGPFEASQDIDVILHDSIEHAKKRIQSTAATETEEDRLMDRIIAAQDAIRP